MSDGDMTLAPFILLLCHQESFKRRVFITTGTRLSTCARGCRRLKSSSKLIQVVERPLLSERLLYLPRVCALLKGEVGLEVGGDKRLARDRAGIGVLLQPLQDTGVVEGVPVFGLDLQHSITRSNIITRYPY
jgi:hypothetical protein